MCRAVACQVCGKVTWKGCGMHVDQVLAGVPAGARCGGHPKARRPEGRLAEPDPDPLLTR